MVHFFFVLLFLFSTTTYAKITSYEINPKHKKLQHIKILDTKKLQFSKMSELSALAYKDGILYALSDKGILFHFKIKIKNKKIKSLKLLDRFPLKMQNLKGKKIDSEGMVLVENSLLISFERVPKIALFTLNAKSKKLKKRYKLHKELQNPKHYTGKNKMLEALVYSKKYGVISVAEKPYLSKKNHIIYGSNEFWKIPNRGDISAMELVSKHKLLILQRKFNFLTRKRVLTFVILNLKKGNSKVIAKLTSSDGWRLDNFEGLTKVKKNLYLMVSDDNNSFFQKTLLVLFQLQE